MSGLESARISGASVEETPLRYGDNGGFPVVATTYESIEAMLRALNASIASYTERPTTAPIAMVEHFPDPGSDSRLIRDAFGVLFNSGTGTATERDFLLLPQTFPGASAKHSVEAVYLGETVWTANNVAVGTNYFASESAVFTPAAVGGSILKSLVDKDLAVASVPAPSGGNKGRDFLILNDIGPGVGLLRIFQVSDQSVYPTRMRWR